MKRVAVFDMAQRTTGAPGKTKFSLKYLIKKIESILDETIKRRLKEEFVEKEPDEIKWKKFCDSFAQNRKGGIAGARIIKVWVYAGEVDEFEDLSKDGTGAWRASQR